MSTSDVLTIILTAALVTITAYYAWQNKNMVGEMAATRRMTILPKLAIGLHPVSPMMTLIRVASIGPGPALDVDVAVFFHPKDGSGAIERRLTSSLMVSGESSDFLPIFGTNDPLQTTEQLADRFEAIRLHGQVTDATGTVHSVEDDLGDLTDWINVRRESRIRYTDPEMEKRLAKSFVEQFKQPLSKIEKQLGEIAHNTTPNP